MTHLISPELGGHLEVQTLLLPLDALKVVECDLTAVSAHGEPVRDGAG